MNGHLKTALVILGVMALAALSAWGLTSIGETTSFAKDGLQLSVLITLVLLIGSSILVGERIGLIGALRALIIWAGLALLLVLAYSYRDDFRRLYHRVSSELSPGTSQSGQGFVRIKAARDGHFYTRATLNGATIRLLIDTGATSTVLSQAAARKAGINVDKLTFPLTLNTANGPVKAAVVKINRFALGDAILRDDRVLVTARPGDSVSVLGMRTLNRFYGYSVRNGVMTIHTR